MVERMKKITMLVFHASIENFLRKLQELGVVHIDTDVQVDNEKVAKTKNMIFRLQKALEVLKVYDGRNNSTSINYSHDIINNGLSILHEVEKEKKTLDELFVTLESMKKEINDAIPFGNFDNLYFQSLKLAGYNFKFFLTTKKAYEEFKKNTKLVSEIFFESGNDVHYVIFYKDQSELIDIIGLEEKLPEKNLLQINKEIKEIEDESKKIEERLIFLSKKISLVEEEYFKFFNILNYDIVNYSAEKQLDDKIFIIKGFCPLKIINKLKEFLDTQDCSYIIEEPTKEDKVPIKLRNNKFAQLFEPIGGLFSLPNYFEIDTVPFFAPFFALFFGLCLGDLGYGFLIILFVLFGFFKVKNKSLKKILLLGLVLGTFTVLGGLLLNTFFGSEIVNKDQVKISFLEKLKPLILFNNPEDRNGPMIFAILLGIVQVIFGQILACFNRAKNYGFQGIFIPLGNIFILFGSTLAITNWMYKPTLENPLSNLMVGPIPLGQGILYLGDPYFTGAVLAGIGVLMVLLFNSLESSIFIRPLTGLWELYQIVTGLLGDILSYIRIFALGLAGGLLGGAFNGIALGLKDAFPGAIVLTIFIMVLGHTLNFLLAALGAFVHPLRLTFVEFYKAIGFTGGGKQYSPFSNKTKENNL